MGLLTPSPPSWHPAPPELREVSARARDACTAWPGGLPNIALGFSFREFSTIPRSQNQNEVEMAERVLSNGDSVFATVPVVVGLSTPGEVHEVIRAWRNILGGIDSTQRKEIERIVLDMFKDSGYYGWSWESP